MATGVAARQGLRRRARSTFDRLRLGFVLSAAVLAVGCSVDSESTNGEAPTVSVAVTSAVTSAPVASTEPPSPAGGPLLLSDGLGAVRFGEPTDTALPLLIDVLGRHSTDDSTMTGVMPGGFGGTTVRFVDFGGLTVIFSDGQYFRDDGVMYFAGWSLAGPGPTDLGHTARDHPRIDRR